MSNQSTRCSSDTRYSSNPVAYSSSASIESSPTRRDFLLLAGMATAASSLIHPSALFAEMAAAGQKSQRRILIPANGHAAIRSAASILAKKLNLDDSAISTYAGAPKASSDAITLALVSAGNLPVTDHPKQDGYTVTYTGGVVVYGARPRSLLFAAGEPEHWVARRTAHYRRNPDFALRNATWHASYPVAEQAAIYGANFFIARLDASPALQSVPDVFAALTPDQQRQLVEAGESHKARNAMLIKEFHDADVDVYALLPYGNNFETWSRALYTAALKAYPAIKGTPMANSHESAALCPSDPLTWKVLDAYVKEWAEQTGADGLSATFWDNYSAFCQDERCKKNGLDKFPNELYEFVSHYHAVLQPMGQRLHLRTWSSGSPHWLGTNYVHAPGYGQFGLSHPELWGRVIRETPADVIIQTKVYHSDCEPNGRDSTLLGHCAPHTEMAEYQMVGQFIGRQFFPASTVNYTAATMQRALKLLGPNGGVEIDAGGTHQPQSFDLVTDIVNGHAIYAWRELAWNVHVDLSQMWLDWASAIYGSVAAPAVVRYMRASEDACTWCWSPLGLGSSTNADFAGNIARREVLLRYTNRYYLPEFAVFLEPTLENVNRMVKQQANCIRQLDEMKSALDVARPHLTVAQAAELTTRLDWFRHFALCNTTLDVSLWRFRYLRALAAKLTTDPPQIKELAAAYDLIEAETPKLFQFDPAQKFSCYRVPLGEIGLTPALGNPRSLMHEIYNQSLTFVQDSVGPDYLPAEWIRSHPQINVPTETRRGAPASGGAPTPDASITPD